MAELEINNVFEVIKVSRPEAKESTLKQYVAQLTKLKKQFETDNYDFLLDIESVNEKLKDLKFTSVRNAYNAIIVLLMALNFDNRYDTLIENYSTLRDKLNQQYVDEQKTGVISDKQKDNFPTMDELQKLLGKLELEIRDKKLKSKRDMTPKEREILVVYTIFQMLIHLPTRNDMSDMILATPSYLKKTPNDEQMNYNYLLNTTHKTNDMKLILNNYKTEKTYGTKEIEVPESLKRVLRMYIKATGVKTGQTLFLTQTGQAMSRNTISALLLRVSQKLIGKRVSSTMIRKAVLSDKFRVKNEEQQKMAHIAGHDVATQNAVYIKSQQ